jgi:hypothetical protein
VPHVIRPHQVDCLLEVVESGEPGRQMRVRPARQFNLPVFEMVTRGADVVLLVERRELPGFATVCHLLIKRYFRPDTRGLELLSDEVIYVKLDRFFGFLI